eukprot:3883783-Alexandrium_andersonii.AAC.1
MTETAAARAQTHPSAPLRKHTHTHTPIHQRRIGAALPSTCTTSAPPNRRLPDRPRGLALNAPS